MSALTSFYLAQSPCGSIDIILILAHGEVLGACSTFAADRAGIAVPPGLVHLEMTFFPLQFAFNFWSSFLKEDFPFRPSGNRGSGSFVSYPQSSMLFRQPRRSRGSKNARRGGGGKATHVSQPATRGAASRDLKSVPVVEIYPMEWERREVSQRFGRFRREDL